MSYFQPSADYRVYRPMAASSIGYKYVTASSSQFCAQQTAASISGAIVVRVPVGTKGSDAVRKFVAAQK